MRFGYLAMAAACAIASPASAAELMLSFYATDFSADGGMPYTPPDNDISAQFTVDLDLSLDQEQRGTISAGTIDVDGVTFLNNEISFIYNPGFGGALSIFATGAGKSFRDWDFSVGSMVASIRAGLAAPSYFGYGTLPNQAGFTGRWSSGSSETTFISYNGSLPAVPEPASWALMILGFGAVGGAMRRRQRVPFALLAGRRD